MQSQEIGFLELLDGKVQYVVPKWQRRYCWGPRAVTRLVEDLCRFRMRRSRVGLTTADP